MYKLIRLIKAIGTSLYIMLICVGSGAAVVGVLYITNSIFDSFFIGAGVGVFIIIFLILTVGSYMIGD